MGVVRVVGLALIVGAAVGVAVSLLTRSINDPMVEITLTVLSAYGAFIAAEVLGLSGVIACVVAGMVTGNWGAQHGMLPATRAAVEGSGATRPSCSIASYFCSWAWRSTWQSWPTTFPRFDRLGGDQSGAWSAGGCQLLRHESHRPPWFSWSWAAVLCWGGLRGGLSMVLALSLPRDFSHREMILHMTFGVVLLTLLVAGADHQTPVAQGGIGQIQRLKE